MRLHRVTRLLKASAPLVIAALVLAGCEFTVVAGGHGAGAANDQLDAPQGVALGSDGAVYVVDQGNNRVQKWEPGADSATTVATGFTGGGGFDPAPRGIAVDDRGNVFVSDSTAAAVLKFSPGSTQGTVVAGGHGRGSAANQFAFPAGLALDKDGNLYVADGECAAVGYPHNDRIQRWSPGATAGVTVAGGNGSGAAANQLNCPYGVDVDQVGNVIVADTSNHRIQRWAPGATSGVTLASGAASTDVLNPMDTPFDVAVTRHGDLAIAGLRSLVYWARGAPSGLAVIAAKPGNSLLGVAVDAESNVYFSDQVTKSVRKFSWSNAARR